MSVTREKIERLLQKNFYTVSDLRDIMEILRSEEGCPWDREQDHHSIRASLIEEAYEVIEAIDNDDPVLLREELGDLLFQVVFHAQIEQEKNVFSLDEVVNDICVKMIHRHPHVFGSVEVSNSREVLSNWEAIKTEEKQRNTLVEKLRAIPPMLPALMRASKISKKAGTIAEASKEDLLAELQERLDRLHQAPPNHESLGDLLLTVTRLAQVCEIDAEHALSDASDRLIDEVEKKSKNS